MLKSSMFSRVVIFSLVFALLVSVPITFAQEVVEAVTASVPDYSGDGVKSGGLRSGINPLDEESIKEELVVVGAQLISATTYNFTFANGVSLEDMSSGTTTLLGASLDDTASALTNIGFDFYFDGTRFTQFSVNPNGLMKLGSPVVNNGANGRTNNLATVNDLPKIAAYWDDMCTSATGQVRSKVVGAPGSRKLIVEWTNVVTFGPTSCTDGLAIGTFQVWLYESSSPTSAGAVQFVYGAIGANSVTQGGFSNGIGSSATSFASVTTAADTVSYAVSDNAQVNSIAAGKSYIFTPNVPAAPTGLTFAPVTASSIQLNWTDNATNEVGYVINRSLDGVTYSPLTTTAANAVSFNDTLLTPGTTYFYQVAAITEGAISSSISGSQMTNPPGADSCNGVGGDWSNIATWTDGSVPTATDNVTIGAGCTVTVDVANATAFNLTIASGGTLQSPLSGAVLTNQLTVGGDLTNNGILDLSTNGDTSGAILVFGAGSADVAFGGSGSTTDVRAITVAKGARATVVELSTTNFTVQGVNTDVAGFLTVTSGTFKVSGTFAVTNRVFTVPAYSIPTLGGFWLNNPNFAIAGQNGSPTTTGLLRVSQGTYNIGTSTGNSMGFATGSNIIVEGGAINAAGRFGVSAAGNAITYNQSGGTITVCTVGNASTTLGSFDLGTTTASSITISGGTIITQLSATTIDYRNQAGLGIAGVTNGTLQLGNASSGAAKNFNIRGVVPNLVITNTSAAHTATFTTIATYNHITLNITINAGNTLTLGNQVFLFAGAVLTNNGTLTHTGASARFITFSTTVAQSLTGSGVVTSPMNSFEFQSDQGFTFDPSISSIVTNRVINFVGNVVNSNKLTVGSGGTSTAIIQIGNTTTPTAAGTFDTQLGFNPGSGGTNMSYLRTTLSRVTGGEVPATRTITNLTYDDNDITHTLTIAGGDLTSTGTLTLTNGVIVPSANTLIHNGTATRTNGFVNGNLSRSYTATGAYTYHVGQNAYSPVLANVTALGTNPSSLTASAVDAPLAGLDSTKSLSRYWNLTEAGDLTADVSFTYAADAADVNGIETDYRVYKSVGGVITNMCAGGPCVNDATNTLGPIAGLTDFSAWSGGENGIIDANAPNTTIDTNPTNPSNSADATFTFSGTDSLVGIASFECRIDAGAWEACVSPKTYTGLANGSHTFDVRAIDTASNPDPTPASYTWVIDTVVPNTTILTNPTNPTTDTNATFTFGASGLGVSYTFECKLDTGMFAACTSPQSYMGLAVGPHTFEVRATDIAGNVDPTPASYAWTINAAATNVTVTATAGTPGPTNYATLKDAIDAINGGTHQGDITVAINSNTTETATSVLNSSGAGSAVYTSVLIRPSADGVTVAGPTVTGRGLIELNGADNVTIDGDNPNSMGTNRNLTIQNTAANTVTFTSVIRVALNVTTVASADNNIFRNLNIVGSATGLNISTQTATTSVANTTYGIVATANAAGDVTAPTALSAVTTAIGSGATASNLMVTNNSVRTVGRGIAVQGSVTTVFPGLTISGNVIGNPTAGDVDQVYNHGILAQGSANGIVSGNTIYVEGYIGSSNVNGTIAIDISSITTGVAGGTFTVEKNKVMRVRNLNGQSWGTTGISLGGGVNHVIQNNFVTDVLNSQVAGTTAFNTQFGATGIRVAGGTGHKVYHNSVNMFGVVPGTVSTLLTSAFGIDGTARTGLDVRNNVFVNTLTGGNPTGTRNVAIAVPTGGTSAMNLTDNNNGYFVGSDAQNRLAQRGTTFGTAGTEYTLADFDPTMTTPATNFRSYTSTLSAAGTNDNASLKVDPLFVSNTDLHLQAASPMLELGANASVAEDIDGDARDSVPDIGADELVAVVASADLSITKTDGVTTATPGGSVTYTITASNAGPDPVTGATVADTFPAVLTATWTCVGAGGGTCTAAGSGNINDTVNLPVGGSVTYTASATINASATGTLSNTATVSSSTADPTPGNNSATDTDTLTPTADLAITKTDGVTTVTPGGSTTYTITASNAGPSDTTGTVADTFPAAITAVNWTCVGAGGGTCTAAGSGNINDAVNLPAGGSVTYTAVSTISGSATGTLTNTATVSGAATDPNPANNSATDVDTVTPAGIGGTINVGTGETYTSLTNTGGLFEAMNTLGVTSNVTINITSDLTGENGTVALNENTGGFTVLIKPTGAPRSITGASTVGIIRINSADGVTIDGSLTGGTATGVGGDPLLRNLTIQNTSATATGGGVVIVMTGTNGANNFTIKNVNVSGQDPTQTLLGIHIAGATPGSSPTTAPNLNARVENCSIRKTILGIFTNGVTATPATGTVITRNDLSGTGANRLRRGGIFFFNQNGIQVTENSIGGIDSNESADSIGIIAGIQNVTTTATASGGVSNALIAGNKINGITASSTVGFSAVGIAIASGTLGPNTVVNNMISGVVGPSTSPDITAGIFVAGVAATDTRVYNNSVALSGDRGTVASQIGSYAIAVSGATPTVDIRNNSFYNAQTSGGGANAKSYAIGTTATAFGTFVLNNNDYFATGANFGGWRRGSLDTTGIDAATLGDWQTATAQDAASISLDPLYTSLTDLHISGTSPLLNVGATIAAVTNDFDGQSRPQGAAYEIGADEVVVVAVPGTLQFSSATYTEGEAGPTATITVTRTGGTDGVVGASYSTVAGGTATGGMACGGAVDYVNSAGTVSFASGSSTPQTFTIPICDDATVEGSETVNLELTTPTGGATLGTPNTAVLTITDNDVTPAGSFSINDVRVTEGNSGTVNAVFTVTYTGGAAASVNFGTANVTATSGSDYVTNSGTLNFPASLGGGSTQPVTVVVNGDTTKEANEVFRVNLSVPTNGATITDSTGYGVIRDEDRSYFADFDDDLKADYSVHRQSEQRHYVLRSSDGGNIVMNFGLATDVAVPGDYDGDGKTDIGLYRPSTSTYYVINSSTNTVKGLSVGAAGDTPVQGDYNGDGRTDLATFSSSGLWSILFINDGTSTAVNFGLAGDRPVQADYDGDAKTDIAVYRDGTWYILRSSDSSVSVSNWGLATDKPVSGDFDGDGRFDLAVYRNGQWWITYSLNGNTGVIAWGLATDVTAAADYDGDGTTDVAIFRPSDGDWYVLQSSTMTITGVHWGLSGDAPIPNRYFAQ